MAQTGYTPILIYSSSTASQAPSAGNLTNSTLGSELAINITDGKLFYKDNANAVQVIGWKTVPTTAGGTGLTSYTAGDLLYYASGTTLTKLGIGAANTVLTSSGSAPQWSTNLNIGSLTATSITDSGNLTFTGTGNRILGDFSNGTFANRVAFQTSTTNSATTVYAIPNGTSTTAGFIASNDSSVTNGSEIRALVTNTAATLTSSFRGTGTTLPLTFDVAGERMRIFTSGGVSIGNTTDPGATNLSVTGSVGIGQTTAAGKLHVRQDQNGTTRTIIQNRNGSGTPISELTFLSGAFDLADDRYAYIQSAGANVPYLDFGTSNGAAPVTRVRITAAGETLTGGTTDNGAYNLQCNGTGVWGAGAYVNGSDERIKEDIAPIMSGLDVVAKLNPVTYRYKLDWSNDQSTQTGFIAQELLTALEDQVYVEGVVQQGGTNGYYSVAYQNIIPILTKAIQEQQTLIEELNVRIAVFEEKFKE